MAGYDNIKDKGFNNRTTGELREIAKSGGRASGEARRRKADFRKTLNQLLTAPVDVPVLTPMIESLGIESTLESAVLMAQIRMAMTGDTQAAKFVAQYAGQSNRTVADDEEQRIRTDRAKRARDQEVGGVDESNDNIQDFLHAINPTQEELDALFSEETEGGEDCAEKAEETGIV